MIFTIRTNEIDNIIEQCRIFSDFKNRKENSRAEFVVFHVSKLQNCIKYIDYSYYQECR